MGTGVLNVSSTNSSSGGIRSYAHCSKMSSDSVTLVLINLDKTDWPNATLEIVATDSETSMGSMPKDVPTMRWLFTGPQGTNSSLVSLNGELLVLSNDSKIPALPGQQEVLHSLSSRLVIPRVPAESVQFVVLEGIGSLAGCS